MRVRQRPTGCNDFAKGNQYKDSEEESQAYRYFSVHKDETFHHFDSRCSWHRSEKLSNLDPL
jgi:hypothetical protein